VYTKTILDSRRKGAMKAGSGRWAAMAAALAIVVGGGPAGAQSGADRKKGEERDLLFEMDLSSALLGAPIDGPKVTGEDLAGRTVLFICSSCDPGNKAWSEFLVRMAHRYMDGAPAGGLVTLFLQQAKTMNGKWYFSANGPSMTSFFTEDAFSMPGFAYVGLPRFMLFDADGRLVSNFIVDGRDLTGGSVHQAFGPRMTPELLQQTIESGSGALAKGGPWKEISSEAQKLEEGGLTGAPLLPILKQLRDKAKNGKGAAKGEATALLRSVKDYLDHQSAVIERNAETNPVLSQRALKRILAQFQGDELGDPFDKLKHRLLQSSKVQEELKAAEALVSVRAHAAKIKWGIFDPDWPVRPKEEVLAIRRGIDELIKKWPSTRAGRSALEVRSAWTRWAAKAIDPLPWPPVNDKSPASSSAASTPSGSDDK
jgi:hypothetical protein